MKGDRPTDDALVVFLPSGRRGRVPLETPLLQAARGLGVDIDSVCGGRGICGRCRVEVAVGAFAKLGITSAPEGLSPVSQPEHLFDGRKGLSANQRLSCHARVRGDVVIDVPAESQLHRQVVRKREEAHPIAVDPVLHPYYVELPAGGPDDRWRHLAAALEAQWSLTDLRIDPALTPWPDADTPSVTVALRDAQSVVAVWPGFHDRLCGLAVDIGTTTIAAHLCDLASGELLASAGMMNPQIRFGEDVMSRISHIQLNPGSGAEMTARVRRAIGQLAADCAAEAGLDPSAILELAVVGNPAMHHLFLGLDALPLGQAPFPLAVADAVTRRTGELDLELPAAGHVYVLPCIAGHVGADAAAVILSEAPHRGEEMTLVIDIGTNAEIVLGNRDRLLACSSPTGPAFEGAQISAGQRATPGAIERLRVDRDGLAPRFKVIGCDLWSDQPGFAEAVAETGITGICGSGIIEAVAELFLAGAIAADGRMVDPADGASPHLLPDGKNLAYLVHAGPPELRISQADIRAIQLAKAAAYAGARLLMERLGVRSLDRIVLTGGFGSYLDPTHAMVLGLIPNCPLERVSAAGNAAGTGARIALLDRGARAEIEALVRQVEKVETAVEPDFQDHFVAAMALPHRHDAFPDLAKVVDLPPPPVPSGRRRRRSG